MGSCRPSRAEGPRALGSARALRELRSARAGPELALTPPPDSLPSGLGGEVGVVAGPLGVAPELTAGSLMTCSAWSTIKVPIAARVISDAGGQSGISHAQQALIESAITASDNAAAERLWAELAERHGGADGAAAAVGEVLRSGGDASTLVSSQGRDGFSPYGQTDWSLAEQQRFIAGLAGGRFDESAGAAYLLGLMGEVIPDQSWGLGSVAVPARFKGGWGPGSDGRHLARQMGVLDLPSGPLAVALAARAEDGTEASATAILDELAGWLAAG